MPEGSPFSGTTRVLGVDVAHAHPHDVTEALRELVDRFPEHPGIISILDAGISNGRPFIVTPHIPGESLDAALGTYGPAALADALPRLQHVADALDAAARVGLCHGALTPADIIVSADDTSVSGIGVAAALSRVGLTLPLVAPYAAPESVSEQAATPHADQYALAAIAYEWLLGQRLDLSRTGLASLALPGVDIALLTRAFERALAFTPEDRFPSCTAFVSGVAESARASEAPPAGVTAFATVSAENEELPLQSANDVAPIGAAVVTHTERRGYGPLAIAAALIAGLAIGALAMRLSGPHAVLSRAAASPTTSLPARAPVANEPSRPDAAKREVTEAIIDAPDDRGGAALPAASSAAESPRDGGPAAQRDAGLLVHSTPAGALVTVDGVPRGTTPVAVRGLALGARTVLVHQRGYRAIAQQVVLTSERPSRTLELELSPEVAVRPAAKSADGRVAIDSRPAGATVFVDGRQAGVTPLMLTLPPGQHTVRMERAGYRAITTRVSVTAGEQTRVAARLEGRQDEE